MLETTAAWCARNDAKSSATADCTSCGKTDALTDVVRREALATARAAPLAALKTIEEMRNGPACKVPPGAAAKLRAALQPRIDAEVPPLRDGLAKAIDALTADDEARLLKSSGLKWYFLDQPSLPEFKAKLRTHDINESTLVLSVVPAFETDMQHIGAARDACGLQGEVRGQSFLMTAERAREVYPSTLDCIDRQDLGPYAKMILKRNVSEAIDRLGESASNCEYLTYLPMRYQNDYWSRLPDGWSPRFEVRWRRGGLASARPCFRNENVRCTPQRLTVARLDPRRRLLIDAKLEAPREPASAKSR